MRSLRALNDESGQILAQIIKIGLIVLVVVFVIAEVGPIIWGRISIINEAEDVANAVAFEYRMTGSESAAVEEAAGKMRLMGYSDDEILQSVVQYLPADTTVKTTVRVTVVRSATTFLTRHLSFMKKLSRVATSNEANVASANQGSK